MRSFNRRAKKIKQIISEALVSPHVEVYTTQHTWLGITCHVLADLMCVGCKKINSHSHCPSRVEFNSCQKGQNIHPSCGKQYGIQLVIFHQGNCRIMEEYVKACENAKCSKCGLESHQLRLFRGIELRLRVEMVL